MYEKLHASEMAATISCGILRRFGSQQQLPYAKCIFGNFNMQSLLV